MNLYFSKNRILRKSKKITFTASSSYSFPGGCRPLFDVRCAHYREYTAAAVYSRATSSAAPHANRLFNLKPFAEKIHFVQMHFLCSSKFHVRLNCFLYVKDLSWNIFMVMFLYVLHYTR